jgi:hypothetical protein
VTVAEAVAQAETVSGCRDGDGKRPGLRWPGPLRCQAGASGPMGSSENPIVVNYGSLTVVTE